MIARVSDTRRQRRQNTANSSLLRKFKNCLLQAGRTGTALADVFMQAPWFGPDARWKAAGIMRSQALLGYFYRRNQEVLEGHPAEVDSTAGPDGGNWFRDGEKVRDLARRLQRDLYSQGYHPCTPRNIQIPKLKYRGSLDPATIRDELTCGRTHEMKEAENSSTRTLAVPKVRDRVAASSVAWVLANYLEPRFNDQVIGCRLKHSAMDGIAALKASLEAMIHQSGSAVALIFDIQDFFGSISRDQALATLNSMTDHQRDPSLWYLIDANFENGALPGTTGLPQGNALSPLLANVYGQVHLDPIFAQLGPYFRYVDDVVLVLPDVATARQALARLRQALKHQGFALSEAKTQIVDMVTGMAHQEDPTIAPQSTRLHYLGFEIAVDGPGQLSLHTPDKALRSLVNSVVEALNRHSFRPGSAAQKNSYYDVIADVLPILEGHVDYYGCAHQTAKQKAAFSSILDTLGLRPKHLRAHIEHEIYGNRAYGRTCQLAALSAAFQRVHPGAKPLTSLATAESRLNRWRGRSEPSQKRWQAAQQAARARFADGTPNPPPTTSTASEARQQAVSPAVAADAPIHTPSPVTGQGRTATASTTVSTSAISPIQPDCNALRTERMRTDDIVQTHPSRSQPQMLTTSLSRSARPSQGSTRTDAGARKHRHEQSIIGKSTISKQATRLRPGTGTIAATGTLANDHRTPNTDKRQGHPGTLRSTRHTVIDGPRTPSTESPGYTAQQKQKRNHLRLPGKARYPGEHHSTDTPKTLCTAFQRSLVRPYTDQRSFYRWKQPADWNRSCVMAEPSAYRRFSIQSSPPSAKPLLYSSHDGAVQHPPGNRFVLSTRPRGPPARG